MAHFFSLAWCYNDTVMPAPHTENSGRGCSMELCMVSVTVHVHLTVSTTGDNQFYVKLSPSSEQ